MFSAPLKFVGAGIIALIVWAMGYNSLPASAAMPRIIAGLLMIILAYLMDIKHLLVNQKQ